MKPKERVAAQPALSVLIYNADGETRTLTSKILEPKSSASTNSATSARCFLHRIRYYSNLGKLQHIFLWCDEDMMKELRSAILTFLV